MVIIFLKFLTASRYSFIYPKQKINSFYKNCNLYYIKAIPNVWLYHLHETPLGSELKTEKKSC